MIDPVAVPFVAATVVAVGAYVVHGVRALRRFRAAWLEAARACGLRDVRTSGWIGFTATARSDSFALRVETVTQRAGGIGLQVQVDTVTDRIGLVLPPLVTDRIGMLKAAVTSREDIVVGEPRLDDRLIISGEPLAVRALLDGETRDLLLALVVGPVDSSRPATPVRSLRMAHGSLLVEAESSRLAGTLDTLLRLAARLAEVPPVEAAVAAVAAGDPLPSVRIASLHALMEERPRHPATRAALRTALVDPAERVRLVAALTLRTEGRAALLGIACNPDSAEDVAVRAIPALGAHFPAEDAERALEEAIRTGRYEAAGACLDSLAARGPSGLAPIRGVLDGASETCAALAAHALGLSPTPEAEPLLVRALDHGSSEVCAAAARSLGRVGTVASVPVLRAVAENGDAALQRIVRDSVASIQSRLSGAGQGQLALASAGGEVTLADDVHGRLGLAKAGTMPPTEQD